MLRLKRPYRDGTTHIVMQPQEFIQHLVALVPCPRHIVFEHGGRLLMAARGQTHPTLRFPDTRRSREKDQPSLKLPVAEASNRPVPDLRCGASGR